MKNRKNSFFYALKESFSENEYFSPALFTLNLKGELVIEGFNKLNEYNEKVVNISAFNKQIYIYGENLTLSYFTKDTIQIVGKINSIEVFEVE